MSRRHPSPAELRARLAELVGRFTAGIARAAQVVDQPATDRRRRTLRGWFGRGRAAPMRPRPTAARIQQLGKVSSAFSKIYEQLSSVHQAQMLRDLGIKTAAIDAHVVRAEQRLESCSARRTSEVADSLRDSIDTTVADLLPRLPGEPGVLESLAAGNLGRTADALAGFGRSDDPPAPPPPALPSQPREEPDAPHDAAADPGRPRRPFVEPRDLEETYEPGALLIDDEFEEPAPATVFAVAERIDQPEQRDLPAESFERRTP